MERIRYIKLHNGGGFVAQMKINYTHEQDGNELNGTYTEPGYHDVTLGSSRTIDLNNIAGIKENFKVRLVVIVVGGHDNTANQEHIYDPNSEKTASYVITGTTLSNHLGEESVS